MLVGYKYCGGCNPYYERGELMERLKGEMASYAGFEFAKADKQYDAGLLIYGCIRRCLASGVIDARHGSFGITSEKDFEAAKAFLMDVYEKIGNG